MSEREEKFERMMQAVLNSYNSTAEKMDKAHSDSCVGMAANMIGVKKNIIVVSLGFMQIAMVNARIVSKKKPFKTEEGCLSLLGGPRPCTRFDEIEVEYQDAGFQPKKDKFNGWTAQIIQHELDHVDGVLI